MNITPLMGLPYPNPAGAPCDFDEEWCAFTAAIDGVFTSFESTLRRTYPAIPAALMQMTVQTVLDDQNPVLFNQVVLDTAGMTDMDADPYGITCRRAGRYTLAGYMLFPHSTGDDQIMININSNIQGQLAFSQMSDLTVIVFHGNNVQTEAVSLVEGERITMSFFQSSAPARTMIEAWLAVYWHADQEVP